MQPDPALESEQVIKVHAYANAQNPLEANALDRTVEGVQISFRGMILAVFLRADDAPLSLESPCARIRRH
jgi:hypothetical protein